MKLVSAVMITRARPEMARRAIDAFLAQTYPNKELVIVDDSDLPSFDDYRDTPEIRYFLSHLRNIPEKRNLGCELANGELICHWDDDDYSAPERIADQVRRIEASTVNVTGYHSMLFYEASTGRVAKYVGDPGYALGTSLMYRRDYWVLHPFRPGPDSPNIGEDNLFVNSARNAGELISVDAGQLMVARVHRSNTSPKDMNKFCAVPAPALPQGFQI